MRFILVASLLALAGCSSHKTQTATDPHSHAHGDVTLASTEGASAHCSSKKAEMASAEGSAHCAAKKAELASTEGASAHCPSKKVEMASTDGAAAHCSSKKAEMASAEGSAHCAAKKAELASSEGAHCSAKVELASAGAHPACGECPKKADGSCDHEAGAKAGKECCKKHLAEATATP